MTAESNDAIVARLRNLATNVPVMDLLGAEVVDFDRSQQSIIMGYTATPEMCHSKVIVQGGLITAMVDSAMAYACMGCFDELMAVPTLEIKVSFLEAGKAGPMIAKASARRLGKSVGFLEGELYQHEKLIATSSSTVRLIPIKSDR
ncbi:MAG: hypothetical protein ACI9DC_002162 [Gammaproteobacteria bacterium]|jgi:uncharacterized protein (TIGR00369 family)